ncbi:MAG: hypothetical protein NZM41_09100, partial [Saprospiraceae bacterium]|nr:hypothetical protein [Saprospiraceae bacterium]
VVHALFFVFEAPADATALTPNPKLDTPLTATWMPVEDVEKKLALPKVVAQFWREKVLSCRQNEIIHL